MNLLQFFIRSAWGLLFFIASIVLGHVAVILTVSALYFFLPSVDTQGPILLFLACMWGFALLVAVPLAFILGHYGRLPFTRQSALSSLAVH